MSACILRQRCRRQRARTGGSAVLDEANLQGMLTELLALHHDAVLADDAHGAVATGDAGGALTLGARKAADGDREGVALRLAVLATANECFVPGGVVHLDGCVAVHLVALERVGLLQDAALVDQPHVLGFDVAQVLGELFHVAHRGGQLQLQLERRHAGDLEAHGREAHLLLRLQGEGAHGFHQSSRHSLPADAVLSLFLGWARTSQ
mmetsp:Transcript_95024/g.241530  ORF Transcript_95024/g.241530 Transcript_95024/m.241530 type:complete len:207 (-) Transcript_95024:28-648(-)